jgi:hypothetical protein
MKNRTDTFYRYDLNESYQRGRAGNRRTGPDTKAECPAPVRQRVTFFVSHENRNPENEEATADRGF